MSGSGQRWVHLDSLRGLAACLVVWVHYNTAFRPLAISGEVGRSVLFSQRESWLQQPFLGVLSSGQFAVCLFFVLSGYVLSAPFLSRARDDRALLAAVLKRPIRLGGLVVVTILGSFLLKHAGLFRNGDVAALDPAFRWFGGALAHEMPFGKLWRDLVFAPFNSGIAYNPPLWTISTELRGSLMVFSLVWALWFCRGTASTLLLAVAAALSLRTLFVGFVAGVWFAARSGPFHQTCCSGLAIWIWRLVAVLGILCASVPSGVAEGTTLSRAFQVLPRLTWLGGGYAMLGAILIFGCVQTNASMRRWLQNPILAFLGRISFAMYVLHFLLMVSFSAAVYAWLAPRLGFVWAWWGMAIPSAGLLLAAAWILTIWFDEPLARSVGRQAARFVHILFVHHHKSGSPQRDSTA